VGTSQRCALIGELAARELAYEANGDVTLRVARFANYGGLSGARIADMVGQEPGGLKEDPRDFALWKALHVSSPSTHEQAVSRGPHQTEDGPVLRELDVEPDRHPTRRRGRDLTREKGIDLGGGQEGPDAVDPLVLVQPVFPRAIPSRVALGLSKVLYRAGWKVRRLAAAGRRGPPDSPRRMSCG